MPATDLLNDICVFGAPIKNLENKHGVVSSIDSNSNEKASTNCSSCSLCPPCGALFDWNSINISWTSCYEPTSSSLLALVLLDWFPSAKWSLGLSLSHYVFTRIPRLPPSQVSFDLFNPGQPYLESFTTSKTDRYLLRHKFLQKISVIITNTCIFVVFNRETKSR